MSIDAKQVVYRNFSLSSEYAENSFFGMLREHSIWDDRQFFLLEWAIYELARENASHLDMTWPLFRIFSQSFLSLNAHFDPNDGFKLKNIEQLEAYDRRERLQLIFEGYFSGDMPDPHSAFEIINPFL